MSGPAWALLALLLAAVGSWPRGAASGGSASPQTLGPFPDLTCPGELPHSPNYFPGETRFVVLGRIYEQLTKAKTHLAEIIAMARRANRTVVLPHCGNSRVGPISEYRFPFCNYFDTSSLSSLVPWVSEEFFHESVLPRLGGSKASVFAVVLSKPMLPCTYKDAFNAIGHLPRTPGTQPEMDKWKHIVPLWPLNDETAGGIPALCLTDCPPRKKKTRIMSDTVLMAHQGATEANIVVVLKGTPHPCFRPSFSPEVDHVLGHLRYAPRLHTLVHRIVTQLWASKPFVAAHWRTEMLLRAKGARAHAMLIGCAKSLVQRVKRARQGDNVPFFLATDVSLDGRFLSSSWGSQKPDGQQMALRAVELVAQGLNAITLQSVLPGIEQEDSGIQGILDKLICARAAVFLVPGASCAGKKGRTDALSSFTREICTLRTDLNLPPCEQWG